MTDIDRFYDLEEKIEEKKAEQQKWEGEKEAIFKNFQKITKVNSIEEAEKKLAEMETSIKEKEKKKLTMITRFFKKYPFLKED